MSPHASVMEAVERMMEQHVGAIAVVDDDQLLGVFTERDLMTRVVARGKDPSSTRISEVMTRNVYAVSDHTPVAAAAALMRANHFRHLPVVDDAGRLCGMVALRYLLYDLMDHYEMKMDDLERYMMEDSRGG
ncbi:MAG TPA: CBS domain-containing protein [Haliangiales bacterium]|nr:CBS domain-containing protein [Haliangiales bacterium]